MKDEPKSNLEILKDYIQEARSSIGEFDSELRVSLLNWCVHNLNVDYLAKDQKEFAKDIYLYLMKIDPNALNGAEFIYDEKKIQELKKNPGSIRESELGEVLPIVLYAKIKVDTNQETVVQELTLLLLNAMEAQITSGIPEYKNELRVADLCESWPVENIQEKPKDPKDPKVWPILGSLAALSYACAAISTDFVLNSSSLLNFQSLMAVAATGAVSGINAGLQKPSGEELDGEILDTLLARVPKQLLETLIKSYEEQYAKLIKANDSLKSQEKLGETYGKKEKLAAFALSNSLKAAALKSDYQPARSAVDIVDKSRAVARGMLSAAIKLVFNASYESFRIGTEQLSKVVDIKDYPKAVSFYNFIMPAIYKSVSEHAFLHFYLYQPASKYGIMSEHICSVAISAAIDAVVGSIMVDDKDKLKRADIGERSIEDFTKEMGESFKEAFDKSLKESLKRMEKTDATITKGGATAELAAKPQKTGGDKGGIKGIGKLVVREAALAQAPGTVKAVNSVIAPAEASYGTQVSTVYDLVFAATKAAIAEVREKSTPTISR